MIKLWAACDSIKKDTFYLIDKFDVESSLLPAANTNESMAEQSRESVKITLQWGYQNKVTDQLGNPKNSNLDLLKSVK